MMAGIADHLWSFDELYQTVIQYGYLHYWDIAAIVGYVFLSLCFGVVLKMTLSLIGFWLFMFLFGFALTYLTPILLVVFVPKMQRAIMTLSFDRFLLACSAIPAIAGCFVAIYCERVDVEVIGSLLFGLSAGIAVASINLLGYDQDGRVLNPPDLRHDHQELPCPPK